VILSEPEYRALIGGETYRRADYFWLCTHLRPLTSKFNITKQTNKYIWDNRRINTVSEVSSTNGIQQVEDGLGIKEIVLFSD
jgi:hypothetical protein